MLKFLGCSKHSSVQNVWNCLVSCFVWSALLMFQLREWAVLVAQLVEWSLLTPEIHSSKSQHRQSFVYQLELNRKDENKEKEAGNGPSLKKMFQLREAAFGWIRQIQNSTDQVSAKNMFYSTCCKSFQIILLFCQKLSNFISTRSNSAQVIFFIETKGHQINYERLAFGNHLSL